MPKKKTNNHQMHAMIVTFSVVAGLALAACQTKMEADRNPAPAQTQEQNVIVTSPVPNEMPVDDAAMMETQPAEGSAMMEGQVQGSADPAFDETIKTMGATMQELNPNELNGADLH